MTEVTILKVPPSSVEWIDEPSLLDRSYLDDVPLIPDKLLQAIISPIIKSEVDLLFDLVPPGTWATFHPFIGYYSRMRKLFKGKILSSFEPDFAIETLDNLFEGEPDLNQNDGDKLYAMLYELTNLNQILETIILRILSSLKP